jgi:AcrR family transcriptional regulator
MDDLAEELGISKKTLYTHFPGKIDLLEAVLADKFASVEETLKGVTRAHPRDFPATLREFSLERNANWMKLNHLSSVICGGKRRTCSKLSNSAVLR